MPHKSRRKESGAADENALTESAGPRIPSPAEIDSVWPVPTRAEINRVLKFARLAATYIRAGDRSAARREAQDALECSRDKHGALLRLFNRLKHADPPDERRRTVERLLEHLGKAGRQASIGPEGIEANCNEIEGWFGAQTEHPPDAEAQMQQLAQAVGDDTAAEIIAIARRPDWTADCKMSKILGLDQRFEGKDSNDWGTLLKVSAAAIRSTATWKRLHPKSSDG